MKCQSSSLGITSICAVPIRRPQRPGCGTSSAGEIVRAPGRIDVNLGGAKIFIASLEGDNAVNPPPPHPHQGLDHFGLTVKDIDAVAAEIKAKGVTFTREPTTIRPGVRICFIRGPEGISIELLERDKKYT
ncbi:lactoylglutathione lyase [Bradyrhizobium japonicum]